MQSNVNSATDDATVGKLHGHWRVHFLPPFPRRKLASHACEQTLVFSDLELLGVGMIFAGNKETKSFTIPVAQILPELTVPTTPTTDYRGEVEEVASRVEHDVRPFLDFVSAFARWVGLGFLYLVV